MGVSSSSPLAFCLDLENDFESAPKSIGPKNDEPKVLCSSGSGKSLESSVRLRARKAQAMTRFTGQETDSGRDSPLWGPKRPKHEAAIKLQKVYKSFRTRRKLADGAVLIEQSWWKLLDFAELKHSSILFFDIQKHETAVSRWSRARTRAAKVGKGLSENGKAQKLALQHWLEAIDPRHRYGHNLHFYYVKWLNSQSKEPFFYWLDIGEGKEVNLVKKCPRSKLQQQCIKYLGPMERKPYEVVVEDGKLVYVETGELLNTTEGCKWIFVLSTSRTLYVGEKKKGSFQHSSFLAGGATLAAGRIVAQDGILKAVWPHSGHYRPTPENFQDFLSFLRDNKVDLTHVMLDSIDEEDSSIGKHVRSNSSCDDLFEKERPIVSKVDPEKEPKEDDAKHGLTKKLKSLVIPSNEELIDELMAGREMAKSSTENSLLESPSDESLNAKDAPFVSKEEDETIPKEDIFDRIESHRKLESFQLGKQLGCKWSTGAGPRIGCLRDYPSGLQCHALEQVNLSPRSKHGLRFEFSPRLSTTPNGGSNLSRCLGGLNHRE